MKIDLTTFFSSLGITGGNTQASNFYEFWKGIIMNGDTEINNITEFMTYQGTNRYEFFKSLNSEYPEVIDETSFYSNIDDVRIYDFKTFYTYAGEYFGGSPTPTPFRWDYTEWALVDCGTPSGNYFYTSTEFPLPGDIVYSDNTLTTPFAGIGFGGYYSWGIEAEITSRGSWEIDTDGTILSNANICLGIYLSSSGLTSPDCNTTNSEYLYTLLNTPTIGSRFFVLNIDNNIIGYLNGENKYYTLFDGFLVSYGIYRIDTNGYLTEEISCP